MYKVFLVEDEVIIREGIRMNIDWDNTQYILCGEATDGEMALAMIQDLKPDIIVTDIKMPFMDGLELSKIIKKTMPWIKIIILSGYDEFDFAREAISIGVDEYLLKPIGSVELIQTLNKQIIKIEEEKKQRMDTDRMRHKLGTADNAIKEGFLEEILIGALNTSEALKRADSLGLEIISKCYLILNIELNMKEMNYEELLKARALINSIIEDRNDIICFVRNSENILFIIKGNNGKEIEETAYEVGNNVKHQVESNTECTLTIGIGSIVQRIGGISKSYEDAKKVLKFANGFRQGQILGIDDITGKEDADLSKIGNEYLIEKLKYIEIDDIENVIEVFFESINKDKKKSLLFAYNILIDLLMAAARLIEELDGDTNKIIPEKNKPELLLEIAGSNNELKKFISNILEKVIEFRNSCENLRYGSVIRTAKEYINQNYSKTEISLHTVAEEVALSPNHFSTIFAQEMGETFIEYLTKVRMEKAKNYLVTTKMKSSEIAYSVGYNEPHYFSYLFKKNIGVTPTEFRNRKK